jgi:hypothetical protein
MNIYMIPQVECIEGKTRQEVVLKFNKRIAELAYANPSWEREGDVFWITYKKLAEEPESVVEEETLHCIDCPYCERITDIYGNKDARVKWGKCMKYGTASVNLNRKVCKAYWENEERRE